MRNQSSNAVNPWSVATSGVLSGIIGAVAGVASYYLAGVGSGLGASVGLQSSSVVHISSGLNIFATFGISSAMATSIGAFTGATIGGFVGGFTINYVSNKVTQELGLNSYLMETPSYVSSWIIKLFQLMYS